MRLYKYGFIFLNDNDSITKKTIIKNNEVIKVTDYTYDDFNRLIEEVVYEKNNNELTETKKELFYYNSFGNITRRVQYKNKTVSNDVSYTYTNDNTNRLEYYLDEMTNDTYMIDYNNTLYPQSIGDKVLEYQGNRLTRYGDVYFVYDSLGKRIRKIDRRNNTNIITNYIYDNDNLVRQTCNNITIDYIYNNTLLEGLTYNNKEYYYVRDITGCIEKIIDNNKKEMVLYRYTSYGQVEAYINPSLSTSEQTIANILMNNNGFVYKGYYYDVETSLFWISSRYYSPELCRFISPDDVEYLDPESVNGLNLYCYCLNNPISYCDPSGHSVIVVLLLILSVVATATSVGEVVAYYNAEKVYEQYKDTIRIENGVIYGSSEVSNPFHIWALSAYVRYYTDSGAKGTSYGLAIEWMFHNIGNLMGMEGATEVNFGKTIVSDFEVHKSDWYKPFFMNVALLLTNPVFYIYELIIELF